MKGGRSARSRMEEGVQEASRSGVQEQEPRREAAAWATTLSKGRTNSKRRREETDQDQETDIRGI